MAQDAGEDVRAAELIAAVSLAVDIGMAQPLKTGLAVCLVAVELAERLGYEPGLRQRTFRLALLQHVGCTVAAAPVAAVMGDEMVMRAHAATLDFADRAEMFRFLLAHVTRANPPLARPAALARAAAGGRRMLGTMADVCEGAVMLGERLGCGPESQRDFGCVYEYWDGGGFPDGISGEQITEPARAVQVATLAVVAHHAGGVAAAADLVRQRSGHSLAPAAAAMFLGEVAAAHHERLDGSGYFRGARAGQLPPAARLLAAADTYHAMTEPRPCSPCRTTCSRPSRKTGRTPRSPAGALPAGWSHQPQTREGNHE